jgi:hypothetical protein
MNVFILVLRLVFACVVVAFLAAPLDAKTLFIGVDMSASNPLLESEVAARAAGQHAAREISSLQMGDWIVVQKFGARIADNMATEKFRLTRQLRPATVAQLVGRYIAGLPSHKAEAQDATNLVAFLEFGDFDCGNGDKLLLLADGIEHSAYIRERKFRSGKPLPKPRANILNGCTVTMFPFGGLLPPPVVKTIRASWEVWMKTAGASFNAIEQ